MDVVQDAEHRDDSTTLTWSPGPVIFGEQWPPSSEGAIRVLLADDDEGFLEHLRALIDHQRELSVVGTATDGLAAIGSSTSWPRTQRCSTSTCRSSTA